MTERSLIELYNDDPERADAVVFGRRTDKSRRGFLKGAGLASMGILLGGIMPFWRNFPAGMVTHLSISLKRGSPR